MIACQEIYGRRQSELKLPSLLFATQKTHSQSCPVAVHSYQLSEKNPKGFSISYEKFLSSLTCHIHISIFIHQASVSCHLCYVFFLHFTEKLT